MLNWSLAFLIIAVLAALFGFGENARIATWLSEGCFAVSTALMLAAVATVRRQKDQTVDREAD